ncbi:hypothetical protein O0L34_g1747 [Tuta absoluta]|nr:hypothetical protein O0L34_g1747 [Tuta absoluta]
MAIGIDTSKWKPRKIKGTPAAKVRNILGIGLITIGMLTGAFFHFSKLTVGIRSAVEKLYEDPIEEVERRRMIAAGLPIASGDAIRRMLEEEERPDLPYK